MNGDDGNDFLNGGTGGSTSWGGKGNDAIVVDNNGDVVVEAANQGTDRVVSSINFSLWFRRQGEHRKPTLSGSAAILSGRAMPGTTHRRRRHRQRAVGSWR